PQAARTHRPGADAGTRSPAAEYETSGKWPPAKPPWRPATAGPRPPNDTYRPVSSIPGRRCGKRFDHEHADLRKRIEYGLRRVLAQQVDTDRAVDELLRVAFERAGHQVVIGTQETRRKVARRAKIQQYH